MVSIDRIGWCYDCRRDLDGPAVASPQPRHNERANQGVDDLKWP